MANILVIDDEPKMTSLICGTLEDAGHKVTTTTKPFEALDLIEKHSYDVVITDLSMPEISGMTVLEKALQKEGTEVVMMTAYGTAETAVAAMKKGAADYLLKPFPLDELEILVEKLVEKQRLQSLSGHYRQVIKESVFDTFIGSSPAAEALKELIARVAPTDTTALISGRSGTGKELVARMIHELSGRQEQPFIAVNCAALAETLLESELFGHEKGAFTGAVARKRGRFELAHSGTIFLDDVDDIPFDLQVKLLNVLQEKRLERVGGRKQIEVDVRVIASTKKDLKKMAQENMFREDLYYRLNVFPIHLPPLQKRRDDIPELVRHFIKLLSPNKNISFSDDVLTCLKNYHWPGNVRELKNIIERLLLLSKNSTKIDTQFLPPELLCDIPAADQISIGAKPLDELMADIEARLIQQALRQTSGNQAKAAELLHIPASTLRTRLKKYRISSPN